MNGPRIWITACLRNYQIIDKTQVFLLNKNGSISQLRDINMNFHIKLFSIVLLFLACIVSSQSFAQVCWKKTYGRGVGTIPGTCDPTGLVKSGLLCYAKPTEPNWYVVAGIARPPCPQNYRDDGLTCWKPDAYGRGGGYPWQFGDWFNLDGARSRCANDNKQGCEQDGLIIYPKCKPGFHAFGCCVCTPDCPPPLIDRGAHCEKPTKVVAPITPSCDSQQQYDAGLCYKKCDAGFYGVGPVCWGNCPKDKPVDCGAMCGASGFACAMAIGDMVLSVGQVVADAATLIASFGTSAASIGVKAAAKASIAASLKSLAKTTAQNMGQKFLTMSLEQKKQTVKTDFKKKYPDMDPELAEALASMESEPEGFDYNKMVDFIVETDPTGIAKAVKSFMHDICEVTVTAPASPPGGAPKPPTPLPEKPSPEELRKLEVAKIPNVCDVIHSLKEYKELKRYLVWYEKFFKLFNPIRKSLVDSIPEDQLYSLVEKNCDLMRNDPAFLSVANTPWQNWTNDQRNAAMKLVALGTKLTPTEAQKFNNFELMGFLRGHFDVGVGNALSPCDVTRLPSVDHMNPNVLSNPDQFKGNWTIFSDDDIKALAQKFLTFKTIEKTNWNRVDFFNILTMDCNLLLEDPSYGVIITTPPEKWTNELREKAIKLIEKATSNRLSDLSHPLKVQQLTNKELLGFFIWNALEFGPPPVVQKGPVYPITLERLKPVCVANGLAAQSGVPYSVEDQSKRNALVQKFCNAVQYNKELVDVNMEMRCRDELERIIKAKKNVIDDTLCQKALEWLNFFVQWEIDARKNPAKGPPPLLNP